MHVVMFGEGAKFVQFRLVLRVDASAVVDDDCGVGELLAHGTEAGDVLGVNQRAHRDTLGGTGAPHGLHGVGIEPVGIVVGLDTVPGDAQPTVGAHTGRDAISPGVHRAYDGKHARIFFCSVNIIVVVETVIGAVGNEDVTGDAFGLAQRDEGFGSETARLEIGHGSAGREGEAFYIGGPDVAMSVDVAGAVVAGCDASGQSGGAHYNGLATVDDHDVRE